MLLKYLACNFKSIAHPVEFSMFPTEQGKDKGNLQIIKTRAGDWPILKRAGLFGPNASGKSSFIESIAFAKNYILTGSKISKHIRIEQFKAELLDIDYSCFEFLLYYKKEVYEYGFSIKDRNIRSEWLMMLTDKGKYEGIFSRTSNENGTSIEVEGKFFNENELNILNILKNTIAIKGRNQLFINKIADSGISIGEDIVDWFENIEIIFPNSKIRLLPIRIKSHAELGNMLGSTLHELDTGVTNISLSEQVVAFEKFVDDLQIPEELASEILQSSGSIVNIGRQCFLIGNDEGGNNIKVISINFNHQLFGNNYRIDFEDESDGTKRLVDLIPILYFAKHSESIFIVDELDRSLHTKIATYFLAEFLKTTEGHNNQIIFSSHDLNLLNQEVLSQDEIWFVEKSYSGETKLRPFSDFEINANWNILLDYLNGRFGAIPNISERKI